jgi:hypothetical protein
MVAHEGILLKLPADIRANIYSYLEPDDLIALAAVTKAQRADLKIYVEEKPDGWQRKLGSGTPLELFLDSHAGLAWLDARLAKVQPDPICAAAAILVPKAKGKAKPELIVTSNTGQLPDKRAQVIWQDPGNFKASWLIKGKYDASLKPYVTQWIECTRDTAIPSEIPKPIKQALLSASEATPDRDYSNPPKGAARPPAPRVYMHAEMKILDLLWYGLLVPPEGAKEIYIGLSLLCCRHCMRAITAFNKHREIPIKVAGTHDVPYAPANWTIPEFLKDPKNSEVREDFFAQYKADKAGFVLSFDPKVGIDDPRPNLLTTT